MKHARIAGVVLLIVGAGVALSMGLSRAWSQGTAPPPTPGEELPPGAQALTSGPVHEAFAKPEPMDAEAPVTATKPPPAAIQETPPAERPAGANVEWIPGYWAWDQTRSDYLWVSGCWRVPPPGMCWVPGYWTPVGAAWEWVGGFWQTCTAEQQIEYLPAPPAPFEVEPVGAAPGVDFVWTPGCWYWVENRWVQRHGYWLGARPGWIWAASHYCWTPHGYVFCGGHWDYDVDARGVLYSPVYFPPEVVARGGFVFSPGICIDLGVLRINLFAYPRYCHYWFGDCYGDAFLAIGIYPWFDCDRYHTWHDPIFAYDRWHFGKSDPRWLENEHKLYDARLHDPALRPARTFAEQQTRLAKLPEAERANFETARPMKSYAGTKAAPVRFEAVNTAERRKIATQATDLGKYREERVKWEAHAPPAAVPTTEHGGPTGVTPTHPGPAAPAPEHRAPAVTPPTEPRVPTETRPPATPPVEPRPPVAPHPPVAPAPTTHTPTYVPPHDVHVTQPERVPVPASPIFHHAPATPVTPPSHPSEEHSHIAPAPAPTPHPAPHTDGKGH